MVCIAQPYNSLHCELIAKIESAAFSGRHLCFAQNKVDDLSCHALYFTADYTCELTSDVSLDSS